MLVLLNPVQQRMVAAEPVCMTALGLMQALHSLPDGWMANTYEQPAAPHLQSFDASLVAIRPGVVRLAAFDAAVNVLAPDAEALALRAVHTLRAWLAVDPDARGAVGGAHMELHDRSLRPRHHNPMASAAIVDLDTSTGEVTATRYGDCEVWVRGASTAAQWVPLFPGDMLTPAARTTYEEALTTLPGGETAWKVQEATLDEPEAWVTPPVGLQDVLTPERATVGGGARR